MIKSKEYLKSRFENGDYPTGEDYENLLDSFWHKSELGQVAEGEERPVSGVAVVAAMKGLRQELESQMVQIIQDILAEMLQEVLAEYVTGTALAAAMKGMATEGWVRTQLADKLDRTTLNTALGGMVSSEAMAEALAQKADATALESALAEKANRADMEAGLARKADAAAVYSKTQIDAVMATRPTQTEMAGEMAHTVADLPNSETITGLRNCLNNVIARVNTLSHVACGSENMNFCPTDIDQIQTPIR